MLDKLKSRKFLITVLTAVLIGLNDAMEIGLSEATINNIVMIVALWIFGEAGVDVTRIIKKKNEFAPGDTGPAE